MDQKKLSMIAAICGGAVFLGALLPWWGASQSGFSISFSGTDFTVGVFVLILGLLGGGAAALMALDKTDAIKIAPKQQILIAAGALALAALLTIIKFFDLKDPTGIASKGIGIWLCLLASIAGAACAGMLLKQGGGIAAAMSSSDDADGD